MEPSGRRAVEGRPPRMGRTTLYVCTVSCLFLLPRAAAFSQAPVLVWRGAGGGGGASPGWRGAAGLCMLAKKKDKGPPGTVADNREARFNFEIVERWECGIELKGTEVKSCRAGKITIRDGYARVEPDGQLNLVNVHIAKHFTTSNYFNHEEIRNRRLLAHRAEIAKMSKQLATKGLTLVPLKAYFNDKGFLKVEVGLCRGKKLADKRDTIKGKDQEKNMMRELKSAGY